AFAYAGSLEPTDGSRCAAWRRISCLETDADLPEWPDARLCGGSRFPRRLRHLPGIAGSSVRLGISTRPLCSMRQGGTQVLGKTARASKQVPGRVSLARVLQPCSLALPGRVG